MIREFIDLMMKCNKEEVVELKEHPESYVLDTEKDRFYVINISNKEKSCWQPIEQVSRHPANGRMMTIRTLSGRVAKSTMSHSFLRRTVDSIEPVRGSELKIGDRVPVLKNIVIANPQYNVYDVVLSRELGMICGEYIINKKIQYPYLKESDKKFVIDNFTDEIREDVFLTNIDFINGFIKSYYENSGFYDARENSITISCLNEQQQQIILLLLNNNNIYGKINVYDNSIVIIDGYCDLFRKVILCAYLSKTSYFFHQTRCQSYITQNLLK
jgi:intein/homing endonuclease